MYLFSLVTAILNNQEPKHTRTVKVEFKSSLNLNYFSVSDAILQQVSSLL